MNRTSAATSQSLAGEDAYEPIQIVSLDNAIPTPALAVVAAIKIDVEGDEVSVLEGADLLLTRSCPIVIVERNQPVELSELFSRRDFHEYSFEPSTRQLIRVTDATSDRQNAIFIRDIELIRQRLGDIRGEPA